MKPSKWEFFVNPVEDIRFQDLEKEEGKSEFWKKCPYDEGLIPLSRGSGPNFYLSTVSRCLLCGQAYHFIDMVENSFVLKFKKKK